MKIKKNIILENIASNEVSLVFSKIVSKGLCCDKVWGISIFPSCRPIRGIYRKSLLNCYVLSIFRVFVLLASSHSDKHMLMRQKV